jgi:hypothetical protein
MRPASELELSQLTTLIRDMDTSSFHTAHAFPKAVAMFVRLFLAGERPHPEDVEHWARDHGWSEQNARDLGEMADVVYYTLREIGRIT